MHTTGSRGLSSLRTMRSASEIAYRSAFLRQDIKVSTILISVVLLINIFLIHSDYQTLNNWQHLGFLLGWSLLFALFSVCTIVGIQSHRNSVRHLDQWTLAWAMAYALFSMRVLSTLPTSNTGYILLNLCVVLGLYALAGPHVWRVVPPLLLSGYTIAIMVDTDAPFAPLDTVAGITAFLAANTLGWIATSNWHRYRKSSFFAHQELEQLYQDAEQQRLEAESWNQTWERILDTSPTLLLVIDCDYKIIRANQAAADHFEATKRQIIGRPCYELICKSQPCREFCLHKAISTTLQPQNIETYIPPLGIEAQILAAPLFDATGRLEAITLGIKDISNWKRAERALKAAQEQYRSLVENCHGLIYTITPSGHITFVSPRFHDLLGIAPQHFLGKHFREMVYVDDIARCESYQKEAVEQKLASQGLEYRIVHGDGSLRWHLSNFKPLFNADGQIDHFVGHAIDITAQKEYQAALKEARVKAEAANAAKSQFLALISHEIRTPLNAIIGFSGLAQKSTDIAELYHYIDILDQSAHQLMDLVNDLLDMSKADAGQLTIDATPFNLHEILDLLHWQFKPMAAKRHLVNFNFHKADNLPTWILGDPLRFRQIISNLVNNALKFTEQGFVTMTVMLRSGNENATHDNLLLLKVEDTGIGIDEHCLPLLFQPFQQLEQKITRKYGGTGLGLAIVRHLVELMGGRIDVSSQLGQGSCFTVQLPCRSCLAPRYKQLVCTSHPKLCVLVVEDNTFNRTLLEKTLADLGHSVTSTATASDALRQMESQRYDCLILDVWMPDMDGIELATRLRHMEALTNSEPTPIIAYTADADANTREQCLAVGIQEVLVKPLDQQKLAESIYQHCYPIGVPERAPAADDQSPEHHWFSLNRQILEDLDNDYERIASYAQLLWGDIDDELDKLEQAMAQADREQLLTIAHSLKGLCVYLSKQEAGAIAFSLHQGAMNRPILELRQLADQLYFVCAQLRPEFISA